MLERKTVKYKFNLTAVALVSRQLGARNRMQ